MSLPWIAINSKLQGGVALINSLNRNKFNLLFKRIIEAQNDEIFTEEEMRKLSETLKLDETNLQLLILSLAHIFKQSSKVILKPTTLQEQLVTNLKLNEDKAEDFVKLWMNETNKQFDLENSTHLQDVSWNLNVQSASKFSNKDNFINARLQLTLGSVEETPNKESLVIELDEEEIRHFYHTLEKIQTKLDSI